MSRVVYSLRIFATGGLSPGAGTVGPIVPDGLVYVVRDIDVVELTATNGSILEVKNQTLGPLVYFERTAADGLGLGSWRGRQIYNEGEQVGFLALSGQWSIACSGYQLTLP
jgi:hypothetical protein